MYLGKAMELSPPRALRQADPHSVPTRCSAPSRSPTRAENRERERIVVTGEPPNPIDPPSGCVFHTRCPRATEICRTVEPPLAEYPGGHFAACHHHLNVSAQEIQGARRSPASPLSAGQEMPALQEAPAAPPPR